MRNIVLVCHNLRSCHNVGSLLRTSDGLGINRVFLTGYTPYPQKPADSRLPHLAAKIHKQIQKTALGAEATVAWEAVADIFDVITRLREEGYTIAALEQDQRSQDLTAWRPPSKLALIVGRETKGVEAEVLETCQEILEIPMLGSKESFNVVQAAAMALFHARFTK